MNECVCVLINGKRFSHYYGMEEPARSSFGAGRRGESINFSIFGVVIAISVFPLIYFEKVGGLMSCPILSGLMIPVDGFPRTS
jgi:hypothetical protein